MTERRIGWLLAAVLAAQLFLLSLQAPASGGAGGSLLEATVVRGVAPLTAAVDAGAAGLGRAGERLRFQRTLIEENRALRGEVDRLRLELMRLESTAADARRLAGALDYQAAPRGELRVADVVYVDHASWLKTLLVYTGGASAAGPVTLNQPVIDSEGLVGRVVLVSTPYAKVQLLIDRSAAVGAMLRRTRRQGLVRSGPDGLELDLMPRHASVEVGDLVVTSGTDGIYPRGIPIGTVAKVEPGEELFHRIALDPAVDFSSLDLVFLLTRPQPPDDLTEGTPSASP